ncbi:unnamed protein product [Mycena citricolor]|uniref:Topoisomerase I damage affected protein 2 n=1 Tax=Mycena citricolor TaxID=2018698 RepID=A0AAD2K3R2_9AGAR|nr:unnamed protein product [Mycena citricolor]
MAGLSSPSFRTPPRSDPASPSPLYRSSLPPPRPPTFDADLLKNYTKALLPATLQSVGSWDPKDKDRVKGWTKEIGDRVKTRMLEIQPSGFKYIVLTQINENLGQGGRRVVLAHWTWNDLICTVGLIWRVIGKKPTWSFKRCSLMTP